MVRDRKRQYNIEYVSRHSDNCQVVRSKKKGLN